MNYKIYCIITFLTLSLFPAIAQQLPGQYIGLEIDSTAITSPILRKSISLKKTSPTTLYVNSLGYHEVYINGEKANDNVLSPAVSQLDKRSLINIYDITPLIRKGNNDIVIWLGQGWYRPNTFKAQYGGPLVKAWVESEIDGVTKILTTTDQTWQGIESGYKDTGTWWALQFGGEKIDGRIAPVDMSATTLNNYQWTPVHVVEISGMTALPQMCEPNKIIQTYPVKSIKQLDKTTWLVEMGRVITGWFEMGMPILPAGTEVKLEYGDNLDKHGNFEHQGESDSYISAGRDGEIFRNKFHHHAFRYVKISNLLQEPDPQKIKSLQISGDYRPTATFQCSDNDINAIHDMIAHTFRCLTFSGYMVDCPHLERTGYGGDGNSSTMALQTMYDVSATYTNWLQAWRDVIQDDGGLPHVAPAGGGGGGPYWCGFIVQAPWRTYLNYADRAIVEECYPYMVKWMQYVDRYSTSGLLQRWPDTPYRGWYLGDWLAPIGVDAGNQTSIDLVNNCFISSCLTAMAKMARMQGFTDDATKYERKRDALNKKIHDTFYNPADSTYATGSQLDMAYPMLVGATPDDIYSGVKEKMLYLSATRYNGHIACGLVGVPIVTEWAVNNNEVDFIYRMLKHRDYPGYLYMIDNGATATWESWDGERSRVHNCYNGIATWFYQSLGGLTPDERHPGYRHFRVKPQIPDGMTWTRVTKDTEYGTIEVAWDIDHQGLTLNIAIPEGSTATIESPKGYAPTSSRDMRDLTHGRYTFKFHKHS